MAKTKGGVRGGGNPNSSALEKARKASADLRARIEKAQRSGADIVEFRDPASGALRRRYKVGNTWTNRNPYPGSMSTYRGRKLKIVKV